MMPIGLLMIEHRLIERMIGIMRVKSETAVKERAINPAFVDMAVDFIGTYADRCHHGKEEDILFKALAGKNISEEHQKIMQELIEEHKIGRNNVKNLVEAKEKYVRGDTGALKDMISNMEILVKFYPKHIEKEDKRFFLPCMIYFTDAEKDKMIDEMHEFDRNMIHEKYRAVVESFSSK